MLAVSGGFRTTVGGLRISVRSPLPIAVGALAAAVWWLASARRARALSSDLESIWPAIERHGQTIVAAIALTVAVTSGVFATRSAAGADASGYLSEAAMLARGRLFHPDDLFDLTRGHDPYLTSPLGWRPAPSDARQAPTYPPGLPLLMAIPQAFVGIAGAAGVVSVSAAIAVAATGMLALHLGGGAAGVLAAALIGFAPVFVHQSIQPMSDVPVTAAWMLSFLLIARHRPGAAGVACAVAVLIRPNLAPLALVPLVLGGNRFRFTIPVALSAVVLGALQWMWYGSPLRSGYGSTEELFAFTNIGPNAGRYVRWLLATSPALVLAIAGLLRLRFNRLAQALAMFACLVVAAYLIYAVFDDWSYLRFLLPAMAVWAVLASVELAAWIQRAPASSRAAALLAIVVAIVSSGVWMARARDSFRLSSQQERVAQTAGFIANHTAAGAVLVAGEQSGSMRYYTGRSILRWEAAAPDALSSSLAALRQAGRPVYVVLDSWEDGIFRAKFASVPEVSLDWPPALDAGGTHRTRVWGLDDRDSFRRGERVETVRLP